MPNLLSLSPLLLLLLTAPLISSLAPPDEALNFDLDLSLQNPPSNPTDSITEPVKPAEDAFSNHDLSLKENDPSEKPQETKEATPVVPNEGEKAANDHPIKEEDTKKEEIIVNPEISNGSGLKKIFSVMCFVGTVLFVALMCYYRIQMERYRVAPFTPPKYCPEFIFPKSTSEKRKESIRDAYQMIEVSEYSPPELNP